MKKTGQRKRRLKRDNSRNGRGVLGGEIFSTFKLMKNSKCSFTVSLSKRTLCCGHSPKLSRMASMSVNILWPLIWAEPDVGGKRPVRIDMVVVFPAPLWPSKAVICPLYICSDSPSTATLEPAEPCKI